MIGIEAFQKKTYELIIAAHQANMNTVNTWALITTGIVTVGHAILGLATWEPWDVLLAPYYGAQAGANIASQLGNIFGQISQLYGVALVASDVLVYYAEFIYLNWGVLAALGVLLCVFPFGIGKRAGFFLVVFPVVSFIMLPLQAFVGPLIAQYMVGFTAGMGFSVLQTFVDPNVIGLLCVPALYLTFTTLATGSLAAFSGASSIPIRGLPSLGALGGRFGSTIRAAGKQSFGVAKKTKGILKDEYRSVKHGGHEIGYTYTLTGTTASGEKVEVRARKRDDGKFVYPSTARTKTGKVVNVDQMVEEGRMKITSSTLPHARLRHGFKWGRDDTVSRYRGHQTAARARKYGEWQAGPVGPIPAGTRGGRPRGRGEATGRAREQEQKATDRERVKRERQTGRTGQTDNETARQREQAPGETTPGASQTAEEANHAFNRNAAEARYDTNSTLHDSWREHMGHHGFSEEELRRRFIESFATYKLYGLGALDASTAAFFRAHLASEKTSQTGRTGTSEVPGGGEHARTDGEERTTGSEGRTAETFGTDETTKQARKGGEERARGEAQRQAQYDRREGEKDRQRAQTEARGADETSEEKTQRQARYAFYRSVAEAKYDTNSELEHEWHTWHAQHGHTHETLRENFIHSFATWKTHGLGSLDPHSAEFFKLHAARFRL